LCIPARRSLLHIPVPATLVHPCTARNDAELPAIRMERSTDFFRMMQTIQNKIN
jgi:hypothetical protein